jgi:hypothetical protein
MAYLTGVQTGNARGRRTGKQGQALGGETPAATPTIITVCFVYEDVD